MEYIPWPQNAQIAESLDDTIIPGIGFLPRDEERFWRDLVRYSSRNLTDAKHPGITALTEAIKDATGGAPADACITVNSGMVYCLASLVPIEKQGRNTGEEDLYDPMIVRMLLENFLKAIEKSIKENLPMRHTDDGIFIDMFQVPQWLFDEEQSN